MLWIIILIVSLIYFFYQAHKNTYHPDLKQINLQIKTLNKTNPIHILHLSDLHMEKISVSPEYLYNELKDKEIDLIALTGDYLDKINSIGKFLEYLAVLHRLNSKYGIYVVFGNHDYLLRKKIKYFQQIIENTGAIVLRNENISLNINEQALNIIGIDDFKTKRSDLKKSYKALKAGINLVLTHDPNVILQMKDYHFDYLLCGHFHGGQVHYPKPYHLVKMGKLARKNIYKGLHFYQERPFYISEGLGQTALNIRFRSKPEITLHKLTS